jgi:hypothetical protein
VAAQYGWPTKRPTTRAAIAPPAAALTALPGKYAINGLGDFTIARTGEGLTVALKDGAAEPLYAAADGAWFVTSMEAELRFNGRDGGGRLKAGAMDVPFSRAK